MSEKKPTPKARKKPEGNLIPADRLSPDQRRAMGAKGGIKSGESKRQKKALREALEILLAMKAPGAFATNASEMFPDLPIGEMTTAQAMAVAMVQASLSGDIRAFTAIRDTVGEKPTDKLDVTGEMKLDRLEAARARARNGL